MIDLVCYRCHVCANVCVFFSEFVVVQFQQQFSNVVTDPPRRFRNTGVCLSVCLFVSLSVCQQLYVKSTERIFTKISSEMYQWTREELFKVWRSSASRSVSRKFSKDSSALPDITVFHNLAHRSGQTDYRTFMKILPQM